MPPDVTAPQVEEDPSLLMDFALSVRDRSREFAQQANTVEQGLYIGCLVRQDNSSWRSGSTYIVSLGLDGRVLLHAKDMALAGRMLNPLIYAEPLMHVAPVARFGHHILSLRLGWSKGYDVRCSFAYPEPSDETTPR